MAPAAFFRSLVLSVAVRNGDAHRKNFGLLYDDPAGLVWLAPTYDVITTTVYLPKDTLSLMWEGSKRWPEGKRLERFGVRRCQLTPQGARNIIAEVAEAVSSVSPQLESVGAHSPKAVEDRTADAAGLGRRRCILAELIGYHVRPIACLTV